MLSGNDLKKALDQYDGKKSAWRKTLSIDNWLMVQLRALYEGAQPPTRPLSTRELKIISKLQEAATKESKLSTSESDKAAHSALLEMIVPPIGPEEVFDIRSLMGIYKLIITSAINTMKNFIDDYDKNKRILQADTLAIKQMRELILKAEKSSGEVNSSELYEAYCFAIHRGMPQDNPSTTKQKLFNAIHSLETNDLFTQKNVITILRSRANDPEDIYHAIALLKKLNLLTKDSRMGIMESSNPRTALDSILKISQDLNLSHDLAILIIFPGLSNLEFSLRLIKDQGISLDLPSQHALKETMLNLYKSVKPEKLNLELNRFNSILKYLIRYDATLNPNIFSSLQKHIMLDSESHIALEDLLDAISTLGKKDNLLNESANDILTTRHPKDLARGFKNLSHLNIFTNENKTALINITNTSYHYTRNAEILGKLNAAQLLNSTNLNTIMDALKALRVTHKKDDSILIIVDMLNNSNLLNQPNLDHVIRHKEIFSVLLNIGQDQAQTSLHVLPPHLFTQAFFDRIIQISDANRNNIGAAVRSIRQQISNTIANQNDAGPANNPALNTAQSTHTSSVHKTVSESAIKLKNQYDKIIKNDESKIWDNILKWASDLSNTDPIHVAAKNALSRLKDSYYVDPVSQVSTPQLIMMSWLAAHDDKKRMGTTDDALKMFTEGLYECQRGYNLDILGKDKGDSVDKAICAAGTFNKMMEKLVGVHPDVEIVFINAETANLKLKSLTKELAKNCLSSADPVKLKELKDLQEESKPSENDPMLSKSAEVLWEKIQAQVKVKMKEEGYLIAFSDEKTFNKTMDGGVWALDELMTTLLEPYQAKVEKDKVSQASIFSSSSKATTPSSSESTPTTPSETSTTPQNKK